MATIKTPFPGGSAALSISQMGEAQRTNLADKTLRLYRRVMQNPEYRERIQKRAEEIRQQGLYT